MLLVYVLEYYLCVTRMYSYVTRVYSYVLVCYSYVARMYSCGVLVTIAEKWPKIITLHNLHQLRPLDDDNHLKLKRLHLHLSQVV